MTMTLCLVWHESRKVGWCSRNKALSSLPSRCLYIVIILSSGTKRGPSGSPPLAWFFGVSPYADGLYALPKSLTWLCRISATWLWQSVCARCRHDQMSARAQHPPPPLREGCLGKFFSNGLHNFPEPYIVKASVYSLSSAGPLDFVVFVV